MYKGVPIKLLSIVSFLFKIDIPKSLIINVNTSLNTENGQEIYDNVGGSIISGYKNTWNIILPS